MGISKRMAMKGLLGLACIMASWCFISCSDDLGDITADAEDNTPLFRRAYSPEQIQSQRLG